MAAFVRTLDPSRPITFASYRAFRPDLARPEDEGSHFVDFVSINTYAPGDRVGAVLDLVHQRYPGKPIVISEFGLREDKAKSSEERRRYFREAIAAMRQRPFVAGASVWTFQDYRSRFPDTAPNGYRPWGVVDPDRTLRDAYQVVAAEFAAARMVAAPVSRVGDRLVASVTVEARPDFPARPLSDLTLRMRSTDAPELVAIKPVPDLVPGGRVEVTLDLPVVSSDSLSVELLRPDGSAMHHVKLVDRLAPIGATR
jgi:beta-glucuronidase